MRRRINATLVLLTLTFLALTACSKTAPGPAQPAAPVTSAAPQETPLPAQNATAPSTPQKASQPETQQPAVDGTCLECESVTPDKDRAGCFKLRPGKTYKNKKGKTVTGRCEPQCIPYARCRSGINTCRLGDTGPIEWFECARKNKNTTSVPKAGSIMVIGSEKRHNMTTGHLGYVEEACPNPDGTWTLRFSHTNYDRKCHLDLDAKVLFNPKTMRAAFQSGPWKPWARDLKILGFILR
jgi:hypothetical protein